jgi:ABC-2 type transport system permease protein
VLRDILRFEWRYHTRQISFLGAVAIFAFLGFALSASGFGPDNVNVNSPYSITQGLGLLSLASVFVLAVFCANAVVRDREHQMEEIVFSTSVEKFEYLFGRFAGSFLAAFTAFSAAAIGMLAGLAMLQPDRVGPLALHHYLWALVVLVLPGMLLAGALLFAVATLTRSMIASVVGAVAIYVFYFIAAALTNSPLMAASAPGAHDAAGASLLDPFGLSAFFEQTRNWTPSERNTRLIALTGNFLWNRIVWIAATVLVWLVVFQRFSFRVNTSSGTPASLPAIEPPPLRPVPYSPTPTRPTVLPALLTATRLELRSFLKSIPFLLLTLLWFGLAFAETLTDVTSGEHGAAYYPVTGFILGSLDQPLSLIATVLIVYYSAEIVWRERMIAMAEVVHATPASNAVFVVSKWLALSAMTLVLVLTTLVATIGVQLVRGYPEFDFGVMLISALVTAIPLILFAAAAVLVQTLSPQKYLGMLLVLVVGIIVQRGEILGLAHPLLRYASAPPMRYSAMNGFGHHLGPFAAFMALWTVAGALLLLLASARWRGTFKTSPFGRRLATTLAIAAVAIAAVLFYNTNVLAKYESNSATLDWREAYERKYTGTALLPQPRIVGLNSEVDLYPKERRYRIRGDYQLHNATATAIPRVLVSTRRDARTATLALSSARLVEKDARFGMWTFALEPPLQPNERRTLRFDLTFDNAGIEAGESDTSIVENGTFLFDRRAFPTIGFRGSYRISGASERRKRGLAPILELGDVLHGETDPIADDWVDFDMTVSTDPDQTALTSGRLQRQWTANGRRYFHYRSDAPIHKVFVLASARYDVVSTTSGKTKVELYFHPQHRDKNIDRILKASADSLRFFEQLFGAYPHDTLRVAETPSYVDFGGYATPGLIFLSEHRGVLIDARDPRRLDLVARRVAHEVAHQWWGHTVSPVTSPGASTIVESLTKYSELRYLESQSGRAVIRQSLTGELDQYLSGRAGDTEEEPLSRAIQEPYLYYRKGAIVMNGLRDLLGDETFHRALRNFVAEQGGPGHPTAFKDLHRHIHAVALPQQRELIDQWLTDVVLYDLRLASAKSRALPDGRFEVTMLITAAKSRGETRLPFHETIEVGLFTRDETPIVTARHALRDGTNTIVMIADRKPDQAIVDPYLTRVDRDRFDHERAVE